MRRAWRSARRVRCSRATTASSTSTAPRASGASRACRPAPTTRSTSTRDTHTAAKCNFCAHRVDDGLEPACVVVCPTHSIWVGDLDDESSGISRLLATNETTVRAPDQGTGPNVFYLGAAHAVLDPLEAPVKRHLPVGPARRAPARRRRPTSPARTPRRRRPSTPRIRGRGAGGSSPTCGRRALGAGALFVAALAAVLDVGLGGVGDVVAPVIAAAAAAATGGAAGVGPQAARALLPALHARQPSVVAGSRRLRAVAASGPRPPRGSAPRRSAPTVRTGGWRCRSCCCRRWPRATRRSCSARPRAVTSGSPLGCYRTCWPRPR